MKEQDGSSDGCTAADALLALLLIAAIISSLGLSVVIHRRDVSSVRSRLTIRGSGTSLPDRMYASACLPVGLCVRRRGDGNRSNRRRFQREGEGVLFLVYSPRGVLFFTLSRSRSPVAIEASWGYRLISLSLCVPLPTPGAPTRMIRAAFFSCLVAVENVIAAARQRTGREKGRARVG